MNGLVKMEIYVKPLSYMAYWLLSFFGKNLNIQ